MRKILLTLLALLSLGVSGAWAQAITVTLVDGTNAPYDTYGTRNNSATPNTVTTNKNSGLAGVVLTAPVIDRSNAWWNTYCLALCPSATQTAETVTFTAPEGYLLLSVNMTAQANSSNYPYDVVFNGTTTNVTGASAKTFTASNILAPSFSFTINHTAESFTSNKWFAVKSLTLQLVKIVTDTNQISANKSYVVKCDRSAWAVANNGTSLSTIGKLDLALSIPDAKQRFAFVTPNGTDYYLYSVNAGKFLHAGNNAGNGGSWVEGPSADKVYFADASSYKANTWRIYLDASDANKNINVGGSDQITVDWWATADAGSAYFLIEAADIDGDAAVERLKGPISVTWNVVSEANGSTVVSGTSDVYRTEKLSLPSDLSRGFCAYEYFTDAACTQSITSFASDEAATSATIYAKYTFTPPFTVSESFNTATWYFLKLKNQRYVTYEAASDPNVTLNQTSGTVDTRWAFVGNPYDGFKIYNKTAGSSKVLASAAVQSNVNAGGNDYTRMVAEDDATYTYNTWTIRESNAINGVTGFYLYNSQNYALNYRANANLAYWTGGTGDGSTFSVEPDNINFAESVAAYASYFEDANKDKYFGISASSQSELRNYFDEFRVSCTEDQYLAFRDAINRALIIPETGYYRLKNKSVDSYFGATTGPVGVASGTGAETIVKLTNNGNGTFYLSSQGKFVKISNIQYGGQLLLGNDAEALQYVIPEAGSVVFSYAAGNWTHKSLCLVNGIIQNGQASNAASKWELEAANSFTANLTDAKDNTSNDHSYASLCVPFNITGLTGASAFKPTLNGNYLSLGDGAATIDAGTPVILVGASGSGTYTATIGEDYVSAPVDASATDALTGVFTGETIDASTSGDYVLGKDVDNDNRIGFYHVINGSEFALSANRAYLTKTASGGNVKGFAIDFNGTLDGVDSLVSSSIKHEVFDLSGRSVKTPSTGIYIVNGKKVVIK